MRPCQPVVPLEPTAPPVPCDVPVARPAVLAQVIAPERRDDGEPFLRGAAEQVRLATVFSLPPGIRQVVNLTKGTVHLYSSGVKTVCGCWRCGLPDAATGSKAVSFASGPACHSGLVSPLSFCRQCFSDTCFLKLGAGRRESCPDSSSSDDSSSSSSSSSSS